MTHSDCRQTGYNDGSARRELVVLSLRYSSWSMRAWLALKHAGVEFTTRTVELPGLARQRPTEAGPIAQDVNLVERRNGGSVTGLFPVLWIGDLPIHESLAIAEWAAEHHPHALLWPEAWRSRALARSLSAEMASGFGAVRGSMSCHLFGSVPNYSPPEAARRQLDRLYEIWDECLQRSGGPYLFGHFTIADCMYFPMLTRLVTYGVPLTSTTRRYAEALLKNAAISELIGVARTAPSIPAYDEYIESLGGSSTARIGEPYELGAE